MEELEKLKDALRRFKSFFVESHGSATIEAFPYIGKKNSRVSLYIEC